MQSLEELQALHARLIGAGQEVRREITHGNACSFYFNDVGDNRIGCYTHTPWYLPQPHAHPMDLSQPADKVRVPTEEYCRATDGFVMAEEWRVMISAKMPANS